MSDVQPKTGDKVKFIGYPSYLQGKKGELVAESTLDDYFIMLRADGGGKMTVYKTEVEVIND